MASISVVIPAYNRETTLGVSLDALLAQTHEDWEAIVIDDGSADATAEVADDYARRDGRITVHRQPNGGVSAARNRGIELARRPWLFFLDADDWILPETFALLSAALNRHPDAALVNGGCIRVLPDGTEVREQRAPTGDDLFLTFARTCAFSIHTSLVRTDIVRALGGFDTSLITCEDWDLWQRITRTGARFVAIPEYIAYYRVRPGSASGNGRRMLEDGLRVIARGHGDDPRLAGWRGPLRASEPSERARPARLYLAAYAAGLQIAHGQDGRELLDLLDEREPGDLSPGGVAGTLFHAVASGRGVEVAQWSAFPPEVHHRLDEFVSAFGAFIGDNWFAFGIGQELETLILLNSRDDDDLQIGRTQVARLRLESPVADVPLRPGTARVLLDVRHGDEVLKPVVMAAFGDRLPAAVAADAVVDAHAWELLRLYLRDAVHPALDITRSGERLVVRRAGVKLADTAIAPEVETERAVHDHAGWDLFLQELWGRPDWRHDRFYAPATRRVLPERAAAETVRAADLAFVEMTEELPDIAEADGPLDVAVTLAGVPLMWVRAVPERGRVTAQALRSAITYAGGFELCHVALREGVLLYDGPAEVPLRERLAAAARRRHAARDGADPFADGWRALADEVAGDGPRLLLGRRRYGQLAGAASRLVQLPADSAPDLALLAQRTGQPLAADDEPATALYAPFLMEAEHEPVEFGARSRGRAAFFERRLSYTAPHLDRTVGELRRPDVLSLLPPGPVDRALEIGGADLTLTSALAARAGALLVCDISWLALQQAATGCAEHANVSFERRDLFEEPLQGGNDLVVCGDVLRWAESKPRLRAAARRLADAVAPGGTLVVSSSAPRAGEIERALVAGGRLVLREEVAGATFKVQRYERPPRRVPGRRGAVVRRTSEADDARLALEAADPEAAPDRGATQTLPVLMYHRISASGHSRARRWRLTPDEFEEQLAHLRDGGYRSIDIDEWAAAVDQDRSVPARSVVLSFDDGFADFGEHAVPLLQRYGFRAELFVVTDHVGGMDSWDEGWDAREPLLDWTALLDLPPEVVRIGSHTARHRALTAVSPREAVHELVRSRVELEERLGRRVASIAYPYGLVDGAVARLAGAVGYEVGFTTMPWWVYPSRNLLQLPRLEVRGGDALSTFARMVERPVV